MNVALSGIDRGELNLRHDEMNATPATAFSRVRNLYGRFEQGVFDNFEEWHDNERRGMFVNEFILVWPFIVGFVCQHVKELKEGQTPPDYETFFVGNAKKTLRSLMKSLGIKGRDEGGLMPLNMKGKKILNFMENM